MLIKQYAPVYFLDCEQEEDPSNGRNGLLVWEPCLSHPIGGAESHTWVLGS
jgi:hypothetical protein